jgi:hypothetical protein
VNINVGGINDGKRRDKDRKGCISEDIFTRVLVCGTRVSKILCMAN